MKEAKVSNNVGKFITFDGPGGVGKSTAVSRVFNRLVDAEVNTLHITQPSKSALGSFIRNNANTYTGYALANLVAADRYHQLESVIEPALTSGRIILCDRYVPSTYVLQARDGVREDFIESISSQARVPDMSFILTASPDVINDRLSSRGTRHRFEQDIDDTRDEVERYNRVCSQLAQKAYNLIVVNTDNLSEGDVASKIYERIINELQT